MKKNSISRRDFFKVGSSALAGSAFAHSTVMAQEEKEEKPVEKKEPKAEASEEKPAEEEKKEEDKEDKKES